MSLCNKVTGNRCFLGEVGNSREVEEKVSWEGKMAVGRALDSWTAWRARGGGGGEPKCGDFQLFAFSAATGTLSCL